MTKLIEYLQANKLLGRSTNESDITHAIEKLKTFIDTLLVEKAKREQDNSALQMQYSQLLTTKDSVNKELQEKKKELDSVTFQITDKISELGKRLSDCSTKEARLDEALKDVDVTQQKLEKERESLVNKEVALSEILTSMEERIRASEQLVKNEQFKLDAYKTQLNAREETIARKERSLLEQTEGLAKELDRVETSKVRVSEEGIRLSKKENELIEKARILAEEKTSVENAAKNIASQKAELNKTLLKIKMDEERIDSRGVELLALKNRINGLIAKHNLMREIGDVVNTI